MSIIDPVIRQLTIDSETKSYSYKVVATPKRPRHRDGYCITCGGANYPAAYVIRHQRLGHRIEWQESSSK